MTEKLAESTLIELPFFHTTRALGKGLRFYHRHQVKGIEHIPKKGRALIIVNHSFATYDIVMLWDAIYANCKRYVRTLVDRVFYSVPIVNKLVLPRSGAALADWDNARTLLARGELVIIAPGGMREWRKPSAESRQLKWDGRYGYAKLAIETQTPVIIAACPEADDIYQVYDSALASKIHELFRAPFVFYRGFGLSTVPKPVKLTHHISEALTPPTLKDGDNLEQLAEEFHHTCRSKMEQLLANYAA